jgi:hypothetical protein
VNKYYYGNHDTSFNSYIDGYVKNTVTQQPIKDALVVGFYVGTNDTLIYRNHTFTYSDGHFMLPYNFPAGPTPNYLSISAMGKERSFDSIVPAKGKKGAIKTNDTIDVGTIYVQDVNCKPSGEPGSSKTNNNKTNPELKSSIQNQRVISKTKIYPNPTKELVNIAFHLETTSQVKADILSMLQNTVLSITLGELSEGDYTKQVNLGMLPNGVYFIKFTTVQGSEVFKLVVNK